MNESRVYLLPSLGSVRISCVLELGAAGIGVEGGVLALKDWLTACVGIENGDCCVAGVEKRIDGVEGNNGPLRLVYVVQSRVCAEDIVSLRTRCMIRTCAAGPGVPRGPM